MEYQLLSPPIPEDDPLRFVDTKKYTDRLKAARKLTGQHDTLLFAQGKINDLEVVAGAMDFRFIGGSFSSAAGEAFLHAVKHAIENKLPFNNAANVEINFLIWVDTLPIEKLTKLPHDYKDPKIKYDKESIEVLEVKKL